MVYHCIIANCKNEGTHLIPKEESLRQKWIAAVSNHLKARSTIKHCSRICGAHFRYSDYFNHPLTVLRRLKRTAIPSLFPGNNEYIKELPLPVSSTLGLTEINTTSTALFGKREQYEEFVLPTTPPPEVTLPQLVADSETINAPKLEQTSPKDKKEFHFNAGNCYKSYSRAPAIKRVEILPYYDIPLIEVTQNDPIKSNSEQIKIEVKEELENEENEEQENEEEHSVIKIEIEHEGIQPKRVYENDKLIENVQKRDVAAQTDPMLQPRTGFSIHNYKNDDEAIHYYTGLENFKILKLVYRTLVDSQNLKYIYGAIPSNIDTLDCFFMVLIILRRHIPLEELRMLYQIPIKQVNNIFITWVRYMALKWKTLEEDLWIDKESVTAYMASDIHCKFPMSRVILDATGLDIKDIKESETLKVVVGVAPSGLITYVSPCFARSATERQIIERSSILDKFNSNDEVMVDKKLNIQDIFQPHGVKVYNMPEYFKNRSKMDSTTALSNKKMARKRVHIENVLEMMKAYKILSTPLNMTEVMLASDIVFICAMLVNFRSNSM